MGGADRTQHALDIRGEARLVDRAFELVGLHIGMQDAFGKVADEQLDHLLRKVAQARHIMLAQRHGHDIEGIKTGRHDDVEIGALGHLQHARDITPQAQDREVDNRVDARGLELVEPPHRVLDTLILHEVAAVVLREFRVHRKEMLMHEHAPELGRIHGSFQRVHRRHRASPLIGEYRDLSPMLSRAGMPGLTRRAS